MCSFLFEEIRNSSLDTRSLRNAKATTEYKEGNKPVACCIQIMWPLYKRRKLYKLSGMCFGRSMLCVSYQYRKKFLSPCMQAKCFSHFRT
jgi:hypothetical protein